MKTIVYYIIAGICLIVFLLYMFGPFGDLNAIRHYVQDGFYNGDYLMQIANGEVTNSLKNLSRIIGLLFWIVIIAPLISLVLWKISVRNRFNMVMVCFTVLILIIFIPKIIIMLNH